jgi:anti-sigma factor RsiW
VASAFGHEGDRLSALLDDELGARDALVVTRHLGRCEPCTYELEQLRTLRARLRGLPRVATPLSFMIEQVVLAPVGGAGMAATNHAVTASWLAVAAGSLLLLAAFLLGGTAQGSIIPPVDAMVVDHVRSVEGGPVVVPAGLDATSGG